MMTNELTIKDNIFDSIKHIDEDGNEYLYVRKLMPLIEYSRWQNFEIVIEKQKKLVRIVKT